MATEHDERVTYGKFLAEHEAMKQDILEMRSEQREFLTQARQVFNIIGEKERWQAYVVKLDVVAKLYFLIGSTITVIWFLASHRP